MEKLIKVVIDTGENGKRSFGKDISKLGNFVSLNHDVNLTSGIIANAEESFPSQENFGTKCSDSPENLPLVEKSAIKRSKGAENSSELSPKRRKVYRADEKVKINRTRKQLFQKINKLNNKQHAFFDIHVRLEYTVNNKDGTLVECDRSWEEKRPENEESLLSQISGLLIPDQSIFSQLVNFSHLVQNWRRSVDKSRFPTVLATSTGF